MYTIKPEKSAKAYGRNLRISRKKSIRLCRILRNKTLKNVKRILNEIIEKKTSIHGKYYTNAANAILNLLESCEKNAESLGLDMERLFVHISAHQGSVIRRQRRKAAFGSRLKSTNIEIILIEKHPRKEKIEEAGREKQPKKYKKKTQTSENKKIKNKQSDKKEPQNESSGVEKK